MIVVRLPAGARRADGNPGRVSPEAPGASSGTSETAVDELEELPYLTYSSSF